MGAEFNSPGPFLKWAGGKRALLGQILPNIPDFTGKYVEPFLGAGAVFFSMPIEIPKIVSDQNFELIDTFTAVRDDPDRLIDELRKHKNEKNYFLELRGLDRQSDFSNLDIFERAARFIYLNKTCFNGLYRVNSNGHFNVPYGYQKNPDIISERQIRSASYFLNQRDAASSQTFATQLFRGDYSQLTNKVAGDDFVYLDPPYHPVSATSNFVTYGKNGFTAANQEELRDEVVRLHNLGAKIMLSNSDTPLIRDLYSSAVFFTKNVAVRRGISAKPESRTTVNELLITNFRMT